MPINFPNSPTDGQIYTVGSRSWQWSSANTSWTSIAFAVSSTTHMVVRTSSVSTAPSSTATFNVFDTANDVLTLVASRRYQVRGQYFVDIATSGTSIGMNTNFSFSAVMGSLKVQYTTFNRTAGTSINRVVTDVQSGGGSTAIQVTAASTSAQSVTVNIDGYIISSSGTLTPTFANTAAGSGATCTILAGSWIELIDIGSSTATDISGDWA